MQKEHGFYSKLKRTQIQEYLELWSEHFYVQRTRRAHNMKTFWISPSQKDNSKSTSHGVSSSDVEQNLESTVFLYLVYNLELQPRLTRARTDLTADCCTTLNKQNDSWTKRHKGRAWACIRNSVHESTSCTKYPIQKGVSCFLCTNSKLWNYTFLAGCNCIE